MALQSQDLNRLPAPELCELLHKALAGPPEEAIGLLRTAASGGVVQAQLVLGQWLLDGHGTAPNPAAALQWFTHAARHGEPMALNMLGQCHAHGWGTAPNPRMAAYWFRLAANAGLDWGMYNFATASALGAGVAQDRAVALEWFRRAAELGHAKSMNMVGSFYEDGWCVEQDLDSALDYYRQAASGGDFRGQFNTSRLLLQDLCALPEAEAANQRAMLHEATHWLRQVPASATARFMRQATAWLACHSLTHKIKDLQQIYRQYTYSCL